jgi:mono/diheme cytochrome c family protein
MFFRSPGVYAWRQRRTKTVCPARFSGLIAAAALAKSLWLKPTQSPVNGADDEGIGRTATPGVNAWARENGTIVFGTVLRRFAFPRATWMIAVAVIAVVGCQQKMAKEPKYLPLSESSFFGDERSSRPDVSGTVARGSLETESPEFQGLRSPPEAGAPPPTSFGTVGIDSTPEQLRKAYLDEFPIPINGETLARGQQRFTIYCAVCHGTLGDGKGTIVERGFTTPPTYHSDRLRQAPVGYLFNVATHGFGAMPALDSQIPPRDRWAIVAYIRALQLSQHLPLKDLPQEEQKQATAELSKIQATDDRAGK